MHEHPRDAAPAAHGRLMSALDGLLHLWRSLVQNQTSILRQPSRSAEWAWVVGRVAVAMAAAIGAALLARDSPAQLFVYGGAGFALLYDSALAWLLRRGDVRRVFVSGLVLDTATLLFAWWGVVSSLAGLTETNDLYLVVFPVLIIGVVRMGPLLGAVYTAMWIGWIWWVNSFYYPADSYDVEQLPIRTMILLVTSLLALRLVARLNAERQRAELMAGETSKISEIGQHAGASLDGRQIYRSLGEQIQDLLPGDVFAIALADPKESTARLDFVFAPGSGREERPALLRQGLIPWGSPSQEASP